MVRARSKCPFSTDSSPITPNAREPTIVGRLWRSARRRWYLGAVIRRLVLIAAGIVAGLVVAEAGLEVLHPLWRVPYPPRCYRPDLYERFDPYGYRLRPRIHVQDEYPPGHPVNVTANADGFRGSRDLHEADARKRIIVLGDSMVFGSGVEERERFTERLEAA